MASITDHETLLFERVIEPDWNTLAPDVARFILGMSFPEKDIARMNELAEKARTGTLSEQDRQELDNYLHVGNVIAIWQSKARQALKRSSSSR